MFSAIITKILAFICAIAFTINTILSVLDQTSSTRVTKIQTQLSDIAFPAILKIAVKPGFDLEALKDAGYESVDDYFLGRSMFHKDTFGWAGHTAEGATVGDVKEIFNNVRTPHKLSDILISVTFYTREMKQFRLKNLTDYQIDIDMAYPNNIFAIDLTRIIETTNGETVNTILFEFKLGLDSPVTIKLEGKTTAVKRPVAQNRYFTSGQQIEIRNTETEENAGKIRNSFYTIGFKQEVTSSQKKLLIF